MPETPHHRTDRKVDAGGDDHRRHAQRDNPHKGEVARRVEQVALRHEGITDEAHDDTDDDQRDKHPEGLRIDDRLQEAFLALPRDLGDINQRLTLYRIGHDIPIPSGGLDRAGDKAGDLFG